MGQANQVNQAIIVHGGAGAIPLERRDAAREGCRAASLAGWEALRAGGSAMDAVQAAIVALENNPSFNSGTGAVLTAEGRAELDAGIMDGQSLQAGAIAGVSRIKNPILLARMVLESPHVLLIGSGRRAVRPGIGDGALRPTRAGDARAVCSVAARVPRGRRRESRAASGGRRRAASRRRG